MDLRKVLIQSRKNPAQQIETLWEHIYQHNVKIDTLSAILTFYLHHRVYPPPVQKAFDTLLIAFTDPRVSKRLRILLFQTVEEMCHWLNPSCIADTVRLSSSQTVVVGMLPCFLINRDIPPPEPPVYERLMSSVTSPGLPQDERGKVLSFLMCTTPSHLVPLLSRQLASWLSYCRPAQTSGSLFRSADVTELDGSPAFGTCTALTLVSGVTDLQQLSLVAFSNMRQFLRHSRCADPALLDALLAYCSTLLTQATKKPSHHHDKHLIAAVLEEVLLLLQTVRDLDDSYGGKCQLMLGTVQLLADQLRATALLVSVWNCHLTQGNESALTERILGSVVKAEFSQGVTSHRVATVVMTHAAKLAPVLARFSPNLFKIIATHPSALVEEFLEIVPHLTTDTELVVEVLHSLLDLPVVSGSVCVHQTALLVAAGLRVPVLVSVKQTVEAEHRPVYQHLMRSTAHAGQTKALLALYPSYWAALRPLFSLGLVEVCSQVTPLLLEVFLEAASGHPQLNTLLLPALLARVCLLPPMSAYQRAMHEIVSKYMSKVCSAQPELLDSSVVQFLSVTSNAQLCPRLCNTIVTTVGDHASEDMVVSFFDTLDALLRELMLGKSSRDLKLEISICTSLAKFASKNASLIPRAIAAFEKLDQNIPNCSEEEKEGCSQLLKELVRILKNPRVANVVLSPSSKEDIALAAIMRVLFQFLD